MRRTTIDNMGPDQLAELRAQLMTQRDLAERLGVSQATVSRWETGDRTVHPRDLRAWRTQLKRIVARRARTG